MKLIDRWPKIGYLSENAPSIDNAMGDFKNPRLINPHQCRCNRSSQYIARIIYAPAATCYTNLKFLNPMQQRPVRVSEITITTSGYVAISFPHLEVQSYLTISLRQHHHHLLYSEVTLNSHST